MFDAAIIGAGPAGSVTARLLAQAGWRVALIEKVAFPRRKVCGGFISGATLPLLDDCGIAWRGKAGPPVHRAALYAGGVMVDAPLPRPGHALGREHLDMMLRDAAVAAGATLFQPADAIAARPCATGHDLQLRIDGAERRIAARCLVEAGGSWRSRGVCALPQAPARPSDLLAFKAHLRGGALPAGLMPLLAFPGGYGGMVRSEDGILSLSCCIRRDRLAGLRNHNRAGEAVLAHIAATTRGAALALAGAVLDGPVLAAGPIRPGLREPSAESIFLCGNRAGEAHPVIADGISMAIQGAQLLAAHLIAGRSGADYAAAWRRRFGPRIGAASLFAQAAMHGMARPVIAQAVRAAPALVTWGAHLAGKA